MKTVPGRKRKEQAYQARYLTRQKMVGLYIGCRSVAERDREVADAYGLGIDRVRELRKLYEIPNDVASFNWFGPKGKGYDIALKRMSEKERKAFEMRFFEGANYEQIAQGIGTAKDQARVYVKRAIKRLCRECTKDELLDKLFPEANYTYLVVPDSVRRKHRITFDRIESENPYPPKEKTS